MKSILCVVQAFPAYSSVDVKQLMRLLMCISNLPGGFYKPCSTVLTITQTILDLRP